MVPSVSAEARAQAEARYRGARAGAFARFAWISGMCWVVWIIAFVSSGQHPIQGLWPIWVTLAMSWQLINLVSNKQHFLDRETRKIERKRLERPH